MAEKQDKEIKCAHEGCKDTFIHSVKDQEFYEEKKFSEPRYCKFHREMRKADREAKKNQQNSPFKPALDSYKERNRFNPDQE